MKRIEKKAPLSTVKTWILPNNNLTPDDIVNGITLAEEGPFQTVQESMEHFELWLKENEKK